MKRLPDKAIIALLDWLDASDRNSKDTDEDWAAGFKEVQEKQIRLRDYFTLQEITGFIINKDELRAAIDACKV